VISEIAGVRVGHWTHPSARTGCTVILLPVGTTASGEVQGAAPGTREWALLQPGRTVETVHAVVLTGGSAFGLAACDGVVRWCEERGVGHPTRWGPVPIVVGVVLYDLGVGDHRVRPGPEEGYAACIAARSGAEAIQCGPVGAGSGATCGKWAGPDAGRDAGLGSAVARHGDLVVAALVAVNAVGEPRPAGVRLVEPRIPVRPPVQPVEAGEGVEGVEAVGVDAVAGVDPGQAIGGDEPDALQATTIGIIVTNARVDKVGCLRLAQSGHDGLARALDPVHTGGDGDALVAAATGEVEAPLETVRTLAAWVVEQAVLNAVPPAPEGDAADPG
jgi:L-aminopeptidase/D-esterase-like protein